MPPFDPWQAARKLIDSLGYPAPDAVSPLPGGRNNLVWAVESGGCRFLLKRYFWSEQDLRDRLGQEWAFLHYLRQIGCRRAPQPLAHDPDNRCALLEFIEGTPIEIDGVTRQDVEAAATFFREINADRSRATTLQSVSEACFTLEDHLSTVAERIARVRMIEPSDEAHAKARELVANTLQPQWQTIETRIRSEVGHLLTAVLPIGHRCLSPSDFGFHNALRQNDGSLRFLDFEYAGWDDPAKTIIDFCNQPDGILPDSLADIFRERAIEIDPAPDRLAARIRLLEPLYQLKWACICLNHFLPGRTFAGAQPDRSPTAQLKRAATMAARASNNDF